MRKLLLLTIALIVYGSLYPWHFHFTGGAHPWSVLWHGWPARFDLWTLRDTILNIALYVPLGFAAAASMRGHSKASAFALATAIGSGLSAAMELLQVYVPGRTCSLADLVTNIIGSMCGAGLAVVFAGRIDPLRRLGLKRLNGSAVLLIALYGSYRLYPFFPIVGRTRIVRGVTALLHPSASPVEIWLQAGEWLALGAILDYSWKKMRLPWLVAAMLVLPLQMVILDRNLTFDEAAGAALAVAIYAWSGKVARATTGLGVLGTGILLRELAPFHLLTVPQAFNWIPFWPTFMNGREEAAVVILAGKAFDYGALMWLLRRAAAPLWPSAIAAAVALLALEWFQRLRPGRTPETTDAVLLLLMAFALWKLDGARHA